MPWSGADRSRALTARLPSSSGEERRQLLAELTELYEPLVAHIAMRFAHRGEPHEDLVQVGLVAVLKAANRFDPSVGGDFSAYVAPTIVGELKRYFRDYTWAVRVPRRAQELQALCARHAEEFAAVHGRSPSVDELAAAGGLTREDVLRGLEAGHAFAAVSLQSPVSESAVLADMLPGSDESEFAAAEWRHALAPLLAALDPLERRILAMRFDADMAQSHIARELGLSQMKVSRTLARALARLREGIGGWDESEGPRHGSGSGAT